MENQEQRKVALSESPSVRLCSKCGWPYPKPHPSSKHRRAHKRICGTIEGYELIDSANLGVSDNERGSDEDPKTPSPKLEKRSSDEMSGGGGGGGGVGGRSNRSEDEVFSDAVTEFPDNWSSPVHEDTLKVAAILSDKKVGSLVDCDMETNQEPQVVVSTGNLEVPNHPTNSSQMHDEVPEAESKPIENAIITEDIFSKSNSDLVSTEDLPLQINDVENGKEIFAEQKTPASSILNEDLPLQINDVENGKKIVAEQKTPASSILNEETIVEKKEENGKDKVSSDVVVTTSETSNGTRDLTSVGLEKFSETSVNIGNSADSTQDGNVLSHRGSNDGENNDDVHVLSLVDDIPMVENAETLITGFKDHKSVEKTLPLTLDFSEEIGPVTDATNKSINNEDDSFSFDPRKSDKSITTSSTGLPFLEGDLKEKDGGRVASVTEEPTEVAADDASDLNITSVDQRPDYVEDPQQTTSEKSQPDSCKKDHKSGQESLEVRGNISTTVADSSVDDHSVLKADNSYKNTNGDGLEFSGATEIAEPDVRLDDGTNNLKKEELQEITTPFHQDTSECGLDTLHKEDSQEAMEIPQESVEASIDPISVEADSDTRQISVENGESIVGVRQISVENGESIVGVSGNGIKQVQEEGDETLTIQPIKSPVIDASVDSSSRSDSLEANWGSISGAAFSTQSDAQGATDTETTRPTTTETRVQPEKIGLQNPETNPKEHQSSAEADTFEAPSFMTLVEPENRIDQDTPSDVKPESKEFQAAWFPSITNVANDSHGRKKNEEMIAKVTNWSVGVNQPQHTPLKSLLVEANPETKLRSPRKEEKVPVLTVNSILGPEAAMDEEGKREIGKEWNSPARYPSEIKNEKKKRKGRPFWIPFICCSSMN